MTISNDYKAKASKVSQQFKAMAVGIVRDTLASTHFISQSVADSCIKAEVKLTGEEYEDIANNRHNVTKQTQKDIAQAYDLMLLKLGL